MRILESREIVAMGGRVVVVISESLDGPIDIEVREFGVPVRINLPKKENSLFVFWKDITVKEHEPREEE